LSPAVDGTWTKSAVSLLVFHPTASYAPDTTYRLKIAVADNTNVVPGSTNVAQSSTEGSTIDSSFTTQSGSTLRLEQLLAELGYLPVSFQPLGVSSGASALASEPTTPSLVTAVPLPGHFVWRGSWPSELRSLWLPGDWTVMTQGAVMAFESQHNLAPDGVPGVKVWAALLQAVAYRDVSATPYQYFLVTKTLPETLEIWSGGKDILQSLVNTGAYGEVTPLGTWAVFLRAPTATMRGTNLDGTKYVDHGVPDVAYFHGNDAVHGFERAAYGFPQSNGCVEVPLSVATTIYGLDPLGTLVTVTNSPLD
jgi:peptidoglycan hydrolase-like protein with peptidoglycan-binding domain